MVIFPPDVARIERAQEDWVDEMSTQASLRADKANADFGKNKVDTEPGDDLITNLILELYTKLSNKAKKGIEQ